MIQFSYRTGTIGLILMLWGVAARGEEYKVTHRQVARSRSGQFLVHPPTQEQSSSKISANSETQEIIQLNAQLLAVSCERVKEFVLTYLGRRDEWRHQVRIYLYPAQKPNEPVRMVSNMQTGGWLYEMQIPTRVREEVLIRALTRQVLLEIIQRSATDRVTAVPTWLNEAFTGRLLAMRTSYSLLLRPRTHLIAENTSQNPIPELRKIFISGNPLRLSDLMAPFDLNGTKSDRLQFQTAAHILLHELLTLQDGKRAFANYLNNLGRSRNQLSALLSAFNGHFTNLNEAEMWWAVVGAAMRLQGGRNLLIREFALEKLDGALKVAWWTGGESLETVRPRAVKLLMSELQWSQLRPILTGVKGRLISLQLMVDPSIAALIEAYLQTITEYVQQRVNVEQTARSVSQSRFGTAALTQKYVLRIDGLDRMRSKLASSN